MAVKKPARKRGRPVKPHVRGDAPRIRGVDDDLDFYRSYQTSQKCGGGRRIIRTSGSE